MAGNKITWDIGFYNPDTHYVYRSDAPMDSDNLPTPLATLEQGVSVYNDTDSIIEDTTYYYRVDAEKMGLYISGYEIPYLVTSGYRITPNLNISDYTKEITVSAPVAPYGIRFAQQGTLLFYADYNAGKVFKYSMSTPFDISTQTLEQELNQSSAHCMTLSPDGSILLVGDYNNNTIVQYSLSNPYDLSSASSDGSVSLSSNGSITSSIDGKYIITTNRNSTLYVREVSTPCDIVSSTVSDTTYSISGSSGSFFGIKISDDGYTIYTVSNNENNKMDTIELETAYSFSNVKSVTSTDIGTGPYDFDMDISAERLFFAVTANDNIEIHSRVI